MPNIIDYVMWRGDIPVSQVPLGEVDALVLSYLSYMPFGGVMAQGFGGGKVLLSAAAAYFLENSLSSVCMMDSEKEDCRLLAALAASERFGSMRVTGFTDSYDRAAEEQFAAVTFVPESGPAFIAFRGTDGTVVGWKEDFNMSFVREVPAQRAALAYMEEAAKALSMPMILGGHSKGGNLAVYAAAFAPQAMRRSIVCVYNFDGPGFNEEVIALPQFREADMRVHTFVPQSSVIGMLLWHAEPFTVVKSDAPGLFQHNPYSWQVMGGRMMTLAERTRESKLAEETIKHWLTGLNAFEREQVIDGIYAVLSASDGKNVSDLFESKNVRAILKAVGNMDEETKEIITGAFRRLGGALKETIPDWFDRAADDFRAMIAKKSQDREQKG